MQKRALRYHRFSDKNQSQGSIERQELITDHWCNSNNVIIENSFNDDGYSAKTFDRPDVQKLLKFIRDEHDKIDYLVVAELTRFSRELGDAISLVKTIQKKYGIRIVSASRNMIYDCTDSASFFMMSIEFTLGNTENLKRESDINGGIYTAKAKEHRYIGAKPPYGYKKDDARQKKKLVIIYEEAAVVQMIFDQYLQNVPIKQILKNAIQFGFRKQGHNAITNLLSNPLYIAKQHVKPYKNFPGGIFPVNHEPIIDEHTWSLVQDKLFGNKKKGVTISDDFPLRGVLHCHCKRLLTGAASKGKMGQYYNYYKCNTASAHNNINADFAHQQLQEILFYLSLPAEMIDSIIYDSYELMEEALAQNAKELITVKKQLEKTEKDLFSLEEKYIQEKITFETYNRWHNDYSSRQRQLSHRVKELTRSEREVYTLLEENLPKLNDMQFVYNACTTTQKQEFLRLVFDNSLYYQDKVYRTPYIMDVFEHNLLILKTKRLLELDKKEGFPKKSREVGLMGSLSNPFTNLLTFISSIRVA